jgi:hypothetical protein
MTLPLVLCACGDPGGGNALAPVLAQLLTEARVTPRIHAYAQSLDLLRARGLDTAPLDATQVEPLLDSPDLRLLLVGTSLNGTDLEKVLVRAARRRGLASLALLDFWSNYAARFSDASGRLDCVPDRIAVMDEAARDALVLAGVEPRRVVITGHPGFDWLALRRQQFDAGIRDRMRRKFSSNIKDLQVLFVSQPLRGLYGADAGSPTYLGYDERLVLGLLVAALERIALDTGRSMSLIVRPHPRESLAGFADFRSQAVRLSVSRDDEGPEIALSSDLVVGMTSMLLVEALQLGCRVVSLQPGRLGQEVFPAEVAAHMRIVLDPNAVESALKEELQAPRTTGARAAPVREGATRRVVDEIYSMVFGESSQNGTQA